MSNIEFDVCTTLDGRVSNKIDVESNEICRKTHKTKQRISESKMISREIRFVRFNEIQNSWIIRQDGPRRVNTEK